MVHGSEKKGEIKSERGYVSRKELEESSYNNSIGGILFQASLQPHLDLDCSINSYGSHRCHFLILPSNTDLS